MITATPMSVRDMIFADAWWERVEGTLEALERAHAPVPPAETRNLTFEQLNLAKSYTRSCDIMERCAILWRDSHSPLVALRFPLHSMTPKTQEVLKESILRSFQNFVRQLWLAVCTNCVRNVERVPDETAHALVEFGKHASNEWWKAVVAVMRGNRDTVCVEKSRIVGIFDTLVRDAVSDECRRLDDLRKCCIAIRHSLQRFGSRVLLDGDADPESELLTAARKWWRTFCRSKDDKSLDVLRRDERLQRLFSDVFDAAPLMNMLDANLAALSIEADDAMHIALCKCMLKIHLPLSEAIAAEIYRTTYLLEERDNPYHACWSGIVLASESQCQQQHHRNSRFALTAPSYLGVFNNPTGAVHLTEDETICTATFTNELPVVRLGRIMTALIENNHLCMCSLGEQFAQRILALEYAKYEGAVLRIMRDVLHPFGYEIGIPFKPPESGVL